MPVDVVRFVELGVLSAAYGTHCQVVFKSGYTRHCHDFFMLSADVSVGKSAIFSYLTAPLYSIQDAVRLIAEQDADEEANPKNIPPPPVVVINDATPEALVQVQHLNGGAASMVSPETPLLSQLSNPAKPWPLAPYNSSHTGESYHVHRITRGACEVARLDSRSSPQRNRVSYARSTKARSRRQRVACAVHFLHRATANLARLDHGRSDGWLSVARPLAKDRRRDRHAIPYASPNR